MGLSRPDSAGLWSGESKVASFAVLRLQTMKQSVPFNSSHKVGLFVAASLLILTWYLLLQAMPPAAHASGRPGYRHEAEYNAIARWERNQEIYVPFVTSDPAWG